MSASIATQLEGKIEAVQKERQRATLERRKVEVHSRNEKARRLVHKLEDCDEGIANLLSQAADCLEALVTIASNNTSTEEEEQAREEFEARAQNWFGNLHDVQMGLRSAVKNLRKAQVMPVNYDASSKSTNTNTASMSRGSASRGHSLALLRKSREEERNSGMTGYSLMDAFVDVGPTGPDLQYYSNRDGLGEETKMSLSALRLQDAAWKQLATSLQGLAVSKEVVLASYDSDVSITSESGSDRTVQPKSRRKSANLNQEEKRALERRTRDLVTAQASQDSRLLGALLQINGQKA